MKYFQSGPHDTSGQQRTWKDGKVIPISAHSCTCTTTMYGACTGKAGAMLMLSKVKIIRNCSKCFFSAAVSIISIEGNHSPPTPDTWLWTWLTGTMKQTRLRLAREDKEKNGSWGTIRWHELNHISANKTWPSKGRSGNTVGADAFFRNSAQWGSDGVVGHYFNTTVFYLPLTVADKRRKKKKTRWQNQLRHFTSFCQPDQPTVNIPVCWSWK